MADKAHQLCTTTNTSLRDIKQGKQSNQNFFIFFSLLDCCKLHCVWLIRTTDKDIIIVLLNALLKNNTICMRSIHYTALNVVVLPKWAYRGRAAGGSAHWVLSNLIIMAELPDCQSEPIRQSRQAINTAEEPKTTQR